MNGERRPLFVGSRRPAASGSRPVRRWWWRILVVAWIVGAVVVWNVVFDAHIVSGARDYVDRQQLFVDGHGPRVDMDQVMNEAQAAGLRAAWLWTGVEAASGAALWLLVRRRPTLD